MNRNTNHRRSEAKCRTPLLSVFTLVLASVITGPGTGCSDAYGDTGRVCGDDSGLECSCPPDGVCTLCTLRADESLCLPKNEDSICLAIGGDMYLLPDDNDNITEAAIKNVDNNNVCVAGDVDFVDGEQPFFDEIIEVDGDLRVFGSSIVFLNMPQLRAVTGDLVIGLDSEAPASETSGNRDLIDLDFPDLNYVGGRVVIRANGSLPVTQAAALIRQLCACIDQPIGVVQCENAGAGDICTENTCGPFTGGNCPG